MALKEVIDSHVNLIEGAVTAERFEEERAFIMKNLDYIFKNLLPLIEKKLKVYSYNMRPEKKSTSSSTRTSLFFFFFLNFFFFFLWPSLRVGVLLVSVLKIINMEELKEKNKIVINRALAGILNLPVIFERHCSNGKVRLVYMKFYE